VLVLVLLVVAEKVAVGRSLILISHRQRVWIVGCWWAHKRLLGEQGSRWVGMRLVGSRCLLLLRAKTMVCTLLVVVGPEEGVGSSVGCRCCFAVMVVERS